MKKRVLSLMLAAALVLGLGVPALAAGQTFSDVPSSYWGYADIEAVAEAGLMNGTGGGAFSPEMKVSVAQFLTLLGRLVFPEVKTEGADWFGPYVTAAQEAKLLDGTQVDTNNVEAEISRYDMAVILRAAAKRMGVRESLAKQSEVKDYMDISTRYAEAVLAVYGMGLIKGDQAGNFNGSNTMMRAEVATVIMRLKKAKPDGSTVTPDTDPEKPTSPDQDPVVDYEVAVYLRQTEHAMSAPAYDKHTYLPGVSAKLYYTSDGGETSTLVGEAVSESEDRWDEEAGRSIMAGYAVFRFKAPENWSKGANFYVSAETVYEGQKLVTGDLRTDGREYKNLFSWQPGSSYTPGSLARFTNVEMTPPTGEKFKFTYQGHVIAMIYPDYPNEPLPGFTVQLHLADGRLLGEAVSKEDGSFSMECEVDALDGAFNGFDRMYYTTASGYFHGNQYERTGKYRGEDRLILESLVDLDVWVSVGHGMNENPDDSVYIAESNIKQ